MAGEEIQIPLPATPGLSRIKEVVITFGPETKGKPIDLTITGLKVFPIASHQAVHNPQPDAPHSS